MSWEQQYLDLLTRIVIDGERRTYRNGDRVSVFRPPRIEVDLEREYPLVTTRLINWEFARDELLWFLTGTDNIWQGSQSVQRIWQPWVMEHGSIGDSYGGAWRGGAARHDQLSHLVHSLRTNPADTGHVATLWLPDSAADQVRRGAIRPCHGTVVQCHVRQGRYLDLATYQRSADVPVGLPYNLASYALLAHMLAQQTGYQVGRLIYDMGDAHIYANQLSLVGAQLRRTPHPSPTMTLEHPGAFEPDTRPHARRPQWPYDVQHITLTGYQHDGLIPYPVTP